MRKVFQNIGTATVVYLFILVVETLFELFQIKETREVLTFLGIMIKSRFTSHEISTTFGPTPRLAVTYLIFVTVFVLVLFVFRKKKSV
ncbi:MAG: hypothetical protein LBV19_02785 [Streptococcaceae bacterium]|jgi:hypothetical protein|nr:hypothetical protein [Streptococcaceae bacterium]